MEKMEYFFSKKQVGQPSLSTALMEHAHFLLHQIKFVDVFAAILFGNHIVRHVPHPTNFFHFEKTVVLEYFHG